MRGADESGNPRLFCKYRVTSRRSSHRDNFFTDVFSSRYLLPPARGGYTRLFSDYYLSRTPHAMPRGCQWSLLLQKFSRTKINISVGNESRGSGFKSCFSRNDKNSSILRSDRENTLFVFRVVRSPRKRRNFQIPFVSSCRINSLRYFSAHCNNFPHTADNYILISLSRVCDSENGRVASKWSMLNVRYITISCIILAYLFDKY